MQLDPQDPDVSAEQLSESVRLLQELGNPADNLIQTFLAHEAVKLDKSLEVLRAQVQLCQDPTKVRFIYMVVIYLDCCTIYRIIMEFLSS